jgi:hypothetical protein
MMLQWDKSPLQGQARVRRFTDAFGFFCEISLRVSSLDSQERRLEGVEVPPHLRVAVAFGIDYALSKVGYSGGWKAELDCFEHHAVDTTAEVVALTAAQAVLRSLDVGEQPLLAVDVDRGIVVFPKCLLDPLDPARE